MNSAFFSFKKTSEKIYKKIFKKNAGFLKVVNKALTVTALLISFLIPLAASACVRPYFVPDNPDCADFGFSSELKIEAPLPSGDGPFSFSDPDGTLNVNLANVGMSIFDWSSDIGVNLIFVKAGDGGNVYDYGISGATSGTDLVTPDEKDISHISFCYTPVEPGTLIVVKQIFDSEEATADQFFFSVNGGSAQAFESDGSNDISVPVGAFSVSEVDPGSAWSINYEGCSGTMDSDGSATCTITNTFVPPTETTIKLIKNVINDNGGTAGPNDFGLTIGGTAVTSGQVLPVSPDTLIAIDEADLAGYSFVSLSGAGCPSELGGTVALEEGQDLICTITNDDQPGTLHVIKNLTNDNGGSLPKEGFSFTVNGGDPIAFEADGQNDLSVDAGLYFVTEPEIAGYATTYDNCAEIQILNGGEATCTITNDDTQPKLTVEKVVVGGEATVADFPLYVDDIAVLSGVATGFNAGQYTVSETSQSNYTAVFSGDCDSETHQVDLAIGDQKNCVITNTFFEPQQEQADLSVQKTVNDNTVDNEQTVTFTILVNNLGPDAATGVTLSDLLPSGLTFVSASPQQGVYNSLTGLYNIDTLANGSSTSLEITATVSAQSGEIVNTAVVNLTETDPDLSNNTSSVTITVNAVTPPPPPPDGGQGGSPDGGGNGPIAQSDAYSDWLAQQAAQAPAPSGEVAGITTPPVPGEVKGATTFLPATGFDMSEGIAMLVVLLSLVGFTIDAKKKLNFGRLES